MAEVLEIRLLGRFEQSGLKCDGLPRKAKGLLAYLAMNQGRAIPRERLADLLWSASGGEQARHSLRQALADVRRAVGSGGQALITTVGSSVVAAAIAVDVRAFEALAQSTKPCELTAAADLYRGEFLADFDIPSEPFMEWLRAERTRLESMACIMLRRLATAHAVAGENEAAIAVAQRLSALDPSNEDSHRLLMQLYAGAGRRGEAMRQFALCSDYLRRELDVSPDEKTTALVDAIRTGAATFGGSAADRNGAAGAAVLGAMERNDSDRSEPAERDEANAAASARSPNTEPRGEAPAGECRQLTVLASELDGFAWLAGRLGAEDLRETTAACYRRCAQVIEQHHGHVARCAGDGLLAYFGYPHAREQDAENAVRAAFALQALAARFGAELGAAVQPCVGIATGIVALDGEPTLRDRIALGEPLTLAGRLQALAKPGQIIVANSTRRLLGRLFDCRDLGSVALKGLVAPVEIADVLGLSSIECRFEALRSAHPTPLVGREEEIELLLRRWQRAKSGEGSVVLLAGEAGIGKSRVAQTILELIGSEKHLPLRVFCAPHRQDSALSPFIGQLEREAGIRRNDTDEQRLDKIETLLGPATGHGGDAVPLVAGLLSVPTGDRYPLLALTPQQRKEKTLAALADHIERLAAARPAVLLIEDVHWADPTSLELVDRIVERAPHLPLLVIATFRPEFVPPWVGRIHTTPITLGRLPPRHCAEIIASVIHGKRLPATIISEIVERTDGIPLFVEELTKAVVEGGELTEAGDQYLLTGARQIPAIPMTLHASLMARLDRLGSARRVAQVGAAIGRRFSHQLISAVAPISPQELDRGLEQLVGAELIWRRGSAPDAEYTFKHALVQDAAYSTLLREPRRALHARIAEMLERHFPEIGASQPELLAHHCTEAGLTEKAACLWGKAGRLSLTRSAMAEAAAQFQKALDQLTSLPDNPERLGWQLEFRSALGAALATVKGFAAPETGQANGSACELWQRLGSPVEFLHLPYGQSRYHAYRGEYDLAQHLDEELLRRSRQCNDSGGLVLGHTSCSRNLMFVGKFASSRSHLEEVLALYDPFSHRSLVHQVGTHPHVNSLAFLGIVLFCHGFPAQALARSNAAIAEARRLDHLPSLAVSLTFGARLLSLLGDDTVLGNRVDELVALATKQGFSQWRAFGSIYRAWVQVKTGKVAEGISLLRNGSAAYRSTGAKQWMPLHIAYLARACEAAGHLEEALAQLDDALQMVEHSGERWFAAELTRQKGELTLRREHPDAAERLYRDALRIAEQQGAKLWELRTAVSLARLCRDQERNAEARDLLAPVYGWFTEGFDTPDLKEAERLLAELGVRVRSRTLGKEAIGSVDAHLGPH